MGFLNKSTITVDAILTKKGREKLATGDFDITKFAVADDDIDYNLWDINHTKGSNFYGQAIENMPLTEAVPDGGKSMRFKLMTLPKNITTIPYGQLNPAGPTVEITGPTGVGVGLTLYNLGSQGGGVTATISDTSVAYFDNGDGQESATMMTDYSPAAGTSIPINIIGKSLLATKSTTLTVVHEATGLTFQKTITVTKDDAYEII